MMCKTIYRKARISAELPHNGEHTTSVAVTKVNFQISATAFCFAVQAIRENAQDGPPSRIFIQQFGS
jgi:hypothetical protein